MEEDTVRRQNSALRQGANDDSLNATNRGTSSESHKAGLAKNVHAQKSANVPHPSEASGFPQDSVVFSYLGNAAYRDGLDLLIDAINCVDTSNAEFRIYGAIVEPEYFGQTMTKVKTGKNVTFHGAYSPHELPGILSQTHMAIVPSRGESDPFMLREILHGGVPVIAASIAGIPEIVHDGKNGLIFQEGNAQDLSKKIQNIIQVPGLITQLKENIQPVKSLEHEGIEAEAGDSVHSRQQLAGRKIMKPDFDGLVDLEHLLSQEHFTTPFESLLTNYSYDLRTKVWRRSEYSGIAYSDGKEIEQRLKRIVESSGDVSAMSVELASQCTDWPTWYHLSGRRGNILRPFEERLRGQHILEIGAGCGAITRYLGEIGAEVFALEGSPQRAAIAAARCRDLPNVTVIAEAIQYLQPVPQFDVVTLIGVLEYARIFFPGTEGDAVDAMLKYVQGFLKPGGYLVLAIENQLGLKYFSGFPEDHMGTAMFGIEEHYRENSVVTFGRKELSARLKKAGLASSQWWYPFPDYKLSTLMVSEQGVMAEDGLDVFSLVRNACAHDLQYPSSVSFNLERAWRPIIRNGLLRDMANSFLVVASNTEIQESRDGTMAVHYASARRPEFSKKVEFLKTQAGEIMAIPTALYPQAIPTESSTIKLHLEHTPYIQGQLWHDRLVDIMTSPRWTFEQVQEWFQVWFDAFKDAAKIKHSTNVAHEKVPGRCMDMVPRNLIAGQGGLYTFFDQEWEYGETVEVGYVILRALTTSIMSLRSFSKPLESVYRQPLALILKLAESIGFTFSDQYVSEFLAWERRLQENVTGIMYPQSTAVSPAERDMPESSSLSENSVITQAPSSQFDCSIIIPVFNRVELTQQCLTALAKVTDGIRYEVIVVDNASTDETKKLLSALGGDIQIVTNETNLGFAKACNQGAHLSRGKYLVFLNNDTIPLSGWLENLIQEVETNATVDVVGSKLLYPDDTIQHAGVVFSKYFEQTPHHIFAGAANNLPAVNSRREFQAVTAACMLVRKETFQKIGGFDEEFVNGFEDIDFCLKVRQLGKKVVYQPRSCLYHLESQSSGRKIHDEANAKLFSSRWSYLWLVDEDVVADESGYVMEQYVSDDVLRSRLVPRQKMNHLAAWQNVAKLQQLLLGKKCQPLEDMAETQKIEALLGQVEEWPSDLGILEWVGRVCETLHCEAEAKRFWEKLLSIQDHPSARLGLARASLKTGDLQEAQKHLDVLKDKFSLEEEGWTLQGILYMQNQEYSLAKRAFGLALNFNHTCERARIGAGMACMGLGENEEAWTQFKQVLSQDPDSLEAIRCLIQVGTGLERWDSLFHQLSHFVERNPAASDIRFALAGVAVRAGHLEKTREQLSWFQLIKPDYEGLEDLANALNNVQVQEPTMSAR